MLSPALRAVATPPSQLDRALLHEAGSVVHRAILRLLPLFDRAVHSCGLQQLQLMSGVAGEAACQLPLLVAGWEAERAPTAESRLRLGVVSLALLDPTLGAALRLACPTPSKPSGSRGDPSPEAAAAAAAAATSLLQQMHLRLCKAAHFCAASDPAEHAERAAQAALAQAGAGFAAGRLLQGSAAGVLEERGQQRGPGGRQVRFGLDKLSCIGLVMSGGNGLYEVCGICCHRKALLAGMFSA